VAGVDLQVVRVILMVIGAGALVIGFVFTATARRGREAPPGPY